ncbi:MAG: DUF1329 domain-containing protein [Rhodospirillaceae bacterium]|nr:DUF1329 domain-containing protein [Rhodospirillaceae bacterium]
MADGDGDWPGHLTPVGAERAGNADGSIPAWSGGFTTVDADWRPGEPRPDPFTGEAPLFAITAANVGQFADQLPEGAKALLARFPGYRMNVYPTHRTAAVPDEVARNIRLNAVRAKPVPAGLAYGVANAAGGIPFPRPNSGLEVMWNHLLAYWGTARETRLSTYVVSAAGDVDLTSSYVETADFPYYAPGITPDTVGPYYFKTRRIATAPPARFGEGYLAWQPLDIARTKFAAWRYLPGERRVRRGPSLSYDTPDPDASGYQTLDEYYIFFGGPDRYDFELLGKAEMIVPYNNNALYLRAHRALLGPRHADPAALRYERHRVWVVEARLAAGKSHVAPRRRFYIDEDTWMAVYADSWDEDGNLWKFSHATMYLMPDVPAVVIGSQFVYDMVLGGYVFGFAFAEGAPHYVVTPPHPESDLSPQSLVTQSAR